MLKSPFPWFGGKARLAKRIVALFPEHKQYIEPFCGAANVFFAKAPCPHETLNDLDHGIHNFLTVLRDNPEPLIALAEKTWHGRELWRECRELWSQEEDPVRRAWRWWVVAVDGWGSDWGHSWGTSVSQENRGIVGMCSTRLTRTEGLPACAVRLQHTQIECIPALECLERYCTPDSLAYCDPPYITDTRRAGSYSCEMTDADHEALVAALLHLPGRFVVSGYAHPIYAPLEAAGWGRVDWDVDAPSACRTRASGLQGAGSCAHQRRTETLWLDPVTAAEKLPAKQLALSAD